MEPGVKALATEIEGREAGYLVDALADVATVGAFAGTLSEADPGSLDGVEVLVPFINSRVGEGEMAAMPDLRLVATRSTGYDHVDLEAARSRGISVANVPAYGENTVAEHTFALVLALSRKVHQAWVRTQRGDYGLEGLRGFDLYGRTFGVVGAGAIGLHAVRIAKGFGMEVLAHDVRQDRLISEVLGFRYVGLEELLERSDIVSLHAPAVPATRHLINRDTLKKMKRGALLVNTARGSLVDTEALVWALDEGILAGAGLDVLEGEDLMQHEDELLSRRASEDELRLLVRNHALERRANVVVTPHIGFNSEEALRRILDVTAENVRAFLAGSPRNLVG